MISSQRQHLILGRLRTRGAVRITALSKEFGVSAMTIRRDIAELADKGLLRRVHGGAVSTSTLLSEPLFSVKSQMDIGLKDAIAGEAIKFVSPGDVIAIGGGTTAYVFAQHLLESPNANGITILTNSIPVAELVQALESKDVEVIVTGGVITRSNSLVGPIADKVIASLRVNTVFLGTHSVSMPRGFLMPNSLEAATDMAMMDIAGKYDHPHRPHEVEQHIVVAVRQIRPGGHGDHRRRSRPGFRCKDPRSGEGACARPSDRNRRGK